MRKLLVLLIVLIFVSGGVMVGRAADGDSDLYLVPMDPVFLKMGMRFHILGAVAKDGSRHFSAEELEGCIVNLHSHYLNTLYGDGNDILAKGVVDCGTVWFVFENPAVFVKYLEPFKADLWLDSQVNGVPVWIYIPQNNSFSYCDVNGELEIGVIFYPDRPPVPLSQEDPFFYGPLNSSCYPCRGYINY